MTEFGIPIGGRIVLFPQESAEYFLVSPKSKKINRCIQLTTTSGKKDYIIRLLYPFIRIDTSLGEKIKIDNVIIKGAEPIKTTLFFGSSYEFGGNVYSTVKNNNVRVGCFLDGVYYVVVIENGNRMTMIPESWICLERITKIPAWISDGLSDSLKKPEKHVRFS
jgi:hypothetical protein